jgi:hypothetical protein
VRSRIFAITVNLAITQTFVCTALYVQQLRVSYLDFVAINAVSQIPSVHTMNLVWPTMVGNAFVAKIAIAGAKVHAASQESVLKAQGKKERAATTNDAVMSG